MQTHTMRRIRSCLAVATAGLLAGCPTPVSAVDSAFNVSMHVDLGKDVVGTKTKGLSIRIVITRNDNRQGNQHGGKQNNERTQPDPHSGYRAVD